MNQILTVKNLKEFVKDLPEKDEYGNDYEVWVGNGHMLSNCATTVQILNCGDILIDF